MCCILTILAWEGERHLHTPAPLGPELHLPVCDVASELVGKCVGWSRVRQGQVDGTWLGKSSSGM